MTSLWSKASMLIAAQLASTQALAARVAARSIPLCSNVTWRAVHAPAARSLLRPIQEQGKRVLFDVRTAINSNSRIDPTQEAYFEPSPSRRIVYDGSTGKFSFVAQDYRFETDTEEPFVPLKRAEHVLPQSLVPLFDAASEQDAKTDSTYSWWRRLLDNAAESRPGPFSARELHYFADQQSWASHGISYNNDSQAFVVGIGHVLLAWDQTWSPSAMTVVTFSSGRWYDLRTHRGGPIASEYAPSSRSAFAFATFGHKLLVWGGGTGGDRPDGLRDGAVYDLDADRWTKLPAEGAAVSCGSATAVPLGDLILVRNTAPCRVKDINPYGYDRVRIPIIETSWSVYDEQANYFTPAKVHGAPSEGEQRASALQFARAGSYLVGIGTAIWIYNVSTNSWSSFDAPNAVALSSRTLSDGRLLLLGTNDEQPTAYVVDAGEQHICRLPLERMPLFAERRRNYQSRVLDMAELGGQMLLWGRSDSTATPKAPPAMQGGPWSPVSAKIVASQGIVVTMRKIHNDVH